MLNIERAKKISEQFAEEWNKIEPTITNSYDYERLFTEHIQRQNKALLESCLGEVPSDRNKKKR